MACLVMGMASARVKVSSGQPGVRSAARGAGWASSTARGPKARLASWAAVPVVMASPAQARFSPTVTGRSPRPASASRAQRSAGPVSLPPVRKNTGLPWQTAATGSQPVPWADTSFQSCQGRPSRAASSWTLEIPGTTRAGIPFWASRSSRPAAPE